MPIWKAQRSKPPPAQLEDRTSLAFSMCVSHAFVAFSSFSFFHSSFFLCHRCRCRFMLCSPKQSPPHSGCLCVTVCVCVCGCCLYLYSNHQTFAHVSCTRTTFKCERVCGCESVRVCGQQICKSQKKMVGLLCSARGEGCADKAHCVWVAISTLVSGLKAF